MTYLVAYAARASAMAVYLCYRANTTQIPYKIPVNPSVIVVAAVSMRSFAPKVRGNGSIASFPKTNPSDVLRWFPGEN